MKTILILAAASVAIAVAGCGSGSAHGKADVVAAENTYGAIAQEIGGTHVSVTSILTNPDADPHLFQPGTKTGLAVAQARVVVQNGLGYDAFIGKLERAAPSKDRVVVDVSSVVHASGNPHLWYDVPHLPRVAAAIAAALTKADPAHKAAFRDGLTRFDDQVAGLRAAVAKLPSGTRVASTERVADYLLEAAGIHDIAPERFTHAIEEGTEPTPAAVSDMLSLVKSHQIRVLLYNAQAVSPITIRVRAAARAAGIPVVGVTETLPPGKTFVGWQLGQVRELAAALAK